MAPGQRYERVPTQQGGSNDELIFDRPSFDEVPLVATSTRTEATTASSASGLDSAVPLAQASGSSSSAGGPAQPAAGSSSTSRPGAVGVGNDGVFANLNVASQNSTSYDKNFEEIEPPSYQDAVYEATPAYFDATVVSSFSDDGDVVVEGFPVGNFFTFFVNLIVSMSFDFIGFLLTSMLATSHAAKVARFSFRVGHHSDKAKTDEEASLAYRTDPETFVNTDQDQIAMQKEWVA
ncbi:hypothetical protein HDU96_009479, partial [Phlyctochytrium bullatum]